MHQYKALTLLLFSLTLLGGCYYSGSYYYTEHHRHRGHHGHHGYHGHHGKVVHRDVVRHGNHYDVIVHETRRSAPCPPRRGHGHRGHYHGRHR